MDIPQSTLPPISLTHRSIRLRPAFGSDPAVFDFNRMMLFTRPIPKINLVPHIQRIQSLLPVFRPEALERLYQHKVHIVPCYTIMNWMRDFVKTKETTPLPDGKKSVSPDVISMLERGVDAAGLYDNIGHHVILPRCYLTKVWQSKAEEIKADYKQTSPEMLVIATIEELCHAIDHCWHGNHTYLSTNNRYQKAMDRDIEAMTVLPGALGALAPAEEVKLPKLLEPYRHSSRKTFSTEAFSVMLAALILRHKPQLLQGLPLTPFVREYLNFPNQMPRLAKVVTDNMLRQVIDLP